MKNRKVAAFLSLLFPGLGHLYLGHYVDGVIFVIATAFLYYIAFFLKKSGSVNPQALNFSSPRSYIFWAGVIFIYLYAIIDSYRKAS